MTKVYVVTDGCYSDYRIMGVFDESHERKAIEYMKRINDRDGGYSHIEEYTLNESGEDKSFQQTMESLGFSVYDVSMSLDGNDCIVTKRKFAPMDLTSFHIKSAEVPDVSQTDEYGYYKMVTKDPKIYSTVWAKSEEHAIKIVNEKRTMWRAYGYAQEK